MTLAIFWYLVLTVLWMGFLLLEGFDFGVGMLHAVVGRDEAGRRAAIATIGPVWDGNEVWLIVAAAATFAAFPAWYATMFSGFYPLLLVVLVALILRGVSFEFRAHAESPRGRRFWDGALTGASLVIPLAIGIVLGGLLHGVPIDSRQEFVGTLADLFSPYAVFTGVTVALVCLLHGAVFLAFRTTGALNRRAERAARVLAPMAVVVVICFAFWTRVNSAHGVLLSVVELGAVLAVIAAAALVRERRAVAAFVATSLTMATVTLSLFAELYPRVMVSTLGAAEDLTVAGTASSPYALTVMTVVLVVLLPVVLLYQGWTYYVFRSRITGTDLPVGGAGGTPPPASPEQAAPIPADPLSQTDAIAHTDGADPRTTQHRAVVRTAPTRPTAGPGTRLAALLIVGLRAALARANKPRPSA